MLPFALAAGLSCPTAADLATALAAEFRPVDEEGIDWALDGLAVALAPAAPDHPVEQFDELCRTMAAFEPLEAPLDQRALFIDVAIDRLAGHRTTLAVIGAEAGRRAGLDVGLVAEPGGGFRVGHRALEPATARWGCAHQVAFSLLAAQIERAQRTGDLAGALRAAELRLELPLADPLRRRVGRELRALRAALN